MISFPVSSSILHVILQQVLISLISFTNDLIRSRLLRVIIYNRLSLIRPIKQSPVLLYLGHSMILFLFVNSLSAQLNNARGYKRSEHALVRSKDSAIHILTILTKLSKKPVDNYENEHSDGVRKDMKLVLLFWMNLFDFLFFCNLFILTRNTRHRKFFEDIHHHLFQLFSLAICIFP